MRTIRLPRSRKVIAGLVVAGAILAPTAAFAVAGFDDVPAGHTHEDGITWVKDNNVTSGCTPTQYCPDDAVTRDQMATFLHRISGNAAGIAPSVNADRLNGLEPSQINPFASTTGGTPTIHTGAFAPLPGASVNVTLPAEGTLEIEFNAETACYGGQEWCSAEILVDGSPAEPAVGGDFALDSTDADSEGVGSWESHSVRRVTGVLPAGTYTVTVDVGTSGLGTASNLRVDDWSLTAEGHLA